MINYKNVEDLYDQIDKLELKEERQIEIESINNNLKSEIQILLKKNELICSEMKIKDQKIEDLQKRLFDSEKLNDEMKNELESLKDFKINQTSLNSELSNQINLYNKSQNDCIKIKENLDKISEENKLLKNLSNEKLILIENQELKIRYYSNRCDQQTKMWNLEMINKEDITYFKIDQTDKKDNISKNYIVNLFLKTTDRFENQKRFNIIKRLQSYLSILEIFKLSKLNKCIFNSIQKVNDIYQLSNEFSQFHMTYILNQQQNKYQQNITNVHKNMQKLLDLNNLQTQKLKWSNQIRHLSLSYNDNHENTLNKLQDVTNQDIDQIKDSMKTYIVEKNKISDNIKQNLMSIFKILILEKSQFQNSNNYHSLIEQINSKQEEEIEYILINVLTKNSNAQSQNIRVWYKKLEQSLIKLITNNVNVLYQFEDQEILLQFLKDRFEQIREQYNSNLSQLNKLKISLAESQSLVTSNETKLRKVEKENLQLSKNCISDTRMITILNSKLDKHKQDYQQLRMTQEKERLEYTSNKSILVKEVNNLRNKLRDHELDIVTYKNKIDKIKRFIDL